MRTQVVGGSSQSGLLSDILREAGLYSNTALAIDFGDPSCYSGSGTTCTDIGPNGPTLTYNLNSATVTSAGLQSYAVGGTGLTSTLSAGSMNTILDPIADAGANQIWIIVGLEQSNGIAAKAIVIDNGSTAIPEFYQTWSCRVQSWLGENYVIYGNEWNNQGDVFFSIQAAGGFPRTVVSVMHFRDTQTTPPQRYQWANTYQRTVTSGTTSLNYMIQGGNYAFKNSGIFYCDDRLYCAALVLGVNASTAQLQLVFDRLTDRFPGS